MSDRLDKNYFGRLITSGLSSPMDVQYQGNYIDIVDTLRITLRPTGTGKIKDYYGRWKKKSAGDGLRVNADGSRSRDILVKTKTYHYGATQTKLVLTPEHDSYTFNPFAGTSNRINFTLAKVTTRHLLDVDGNPIGEEEIISSEDVTSRLQLGPGACSFSHGTAYFAINNEQTATQHATVYTRNENNSEGENHDTLIVATSVTIDAVTYTSTARVPLLQTTTYFDELIWSAVAENNVRYYIMANSSGLLFHRYNWKNNTLYKLNTTTQLKVGVASSETDEYITPWKFDYVAGHSDQLQLRTELNVNKNFVADNPRCVASDADPSILTYRYEAIYRNDNNNEEELVRLKYGSDKWLKLQITDGNPEIVLWDDSLTATVFSWGYMDREYYLQNNGDYPKLNADPEFFYNRTSPAEIQTRYKGYRLYSMLIDNKLTYLCREDENDIADLINGAGDWLTDFSITHIRDARAFDGGTQLSGLSISTDTATLKTLVTPAGTSPIDVKIGGKYVNIVDTLDVQIALQHDAPEYRFADKWKSYQSVDDAHLKIPLIRRTYHEAAYDSLICVIADGEEYNYAFPAQIVADDNDEYTFILGTELHSGRHVLNVDNEPVALINPQTQDVTSGMHLDNPSYAEVRLVDGRGNTPNWCRIEGKTANSITIKALSSGIRSPRQAYIYLAYIVTIGGRQRFVSARLTVTQASLFQYTNNQLLIHTQGASGDTLMSNGMQQVHENRRILYYYNPTNINHSPDQNVELPVRERAFYGWWRWYRESDDPTIGDTDIPDSLWVQPPRNVGKTDKLSFPFRRIGKKVPVDPEHPEGDSILVTMGRYTVFHYPSKEYNNKKDPPSKNPTVCPPTNKDTVIYAVDISNYYDNLPLSMKNINQVDTGKLDTMSVITEPTLSLREVFELHPWTEMAERLEGYKDTIASAHRNLKYMEDHVVMAPTGNRLLLSTEQRYIYDNLKPTEDNPDGHSESLLGYYMRDDNWSTGGWSDARKDTMIWCGGWDVTCGWYTYNPGTQTYDTCRHTITKSDDFLQVPALSNITPGQDADTVYYCLRARSQSTTGTPGVNEATEDGAYWFNICRYMIIYHWKDRYGPKEETRGKALITNDEIEQKYEVLERLDFDYNKPGSGYTIYPHPLPWADASYGFAYPMTDALPDFLPNCW